MSKKHGTISQDKDRCYLCTWLQMAAILTFWRHVSALLRCDELQHHVGGEEAQGIFQAHDQLQRFLQLLLPGALVRCQLTRLL